jgi:hypothetical protein
LGPQEVVAVPEVVQEATAPTIAAAGDTADKRKAARAARFGLEPAEASAEPAPKTALSEDAIARLKARVRELETTARVFSSPDPPPRSCSFPI